MAYGSNASSPDAVEANPTDDLTVTRESYKQWTSSDDVIFLPSGPTKERLIPAVYEVATSPNIGLFFRRIPVRTQGLLRFEDTDSSRVVSEIERFWDSEKLFREFRIPYKRGILLYGPPGSGKSCTLQLLTEDVIKRGGICVRFGHPDIVTEGLRILQRIQPETPIVVLMEDLDAILRQYNESDVLNLLDGINQVDRTVFLATTNYPDQLGPRIINRPSRFDKRFRIGYPNATSREMYFRHLMSNEQIERFKVDLPKWVEDTADMSVAHLKELFVAVIILGDTYKEAVKTLQEMKEVVIEREYEKDMGFGAPKKARR